MEVSDGRAGCNGKADSSLPVKQPYDNVRRLFYNGIRGLSIGKSKQNLTLSQLLEVILLW